MTSQHSAGGTLTVADLLERVPRSQDRPVKRHRRHQVDLSRVRVLVRTVRDRERSQPAVVRRFRVGLLAATVSLLVAALAGTYPDIRYNTPSPVQDEKMVPTSREEWPW